MPDDQPLFDEFVLFCGPCHDDGREDRLLARVGIPNRTDDAAEWFLKRRLKVPVDKSDTSVETSMIFGDNHRWIESGWTWEEGPIVFDGCSRHVIERNRKQLAKVIGRAYQAGEPSIYVTG